MNLPATCCGEIHFTTDDRGRHYGPCRCLDHPSRRLDGDLDQGLYRNPFLQAGLDQRPNSREYSCCCIYLNHDLSVDLRP